MRQRKSIARWPGLILIGRGLALVVASAAVAGCTMSSAAQVREADLRAREHVAQAARLTDEGQLDQAITELQLAIQANPELTTAHVNLGELYRVQGDYPSAERSYREAARTDPRSFDAQYGHGLVLQLMDRVAEAVGAYLRALAINADDFNANLNLATAYLQQQQARQALPYAEKAVALNPEDGPARVNLGAVYATLGDHERAIRAYQAAAELMDLSPPLLLNLANSLGQTGRYREMVNTLGQLLRVEPSAEAYERLGFAYFRLNRIEDALAAFRNAVALNDRHYPALNGLGVCLLNRFLMSDREDAEARREGVEALRRSLRINRRQPRIVDLVSRYG